MRRGKNGTEVGVAAAAAFELVVPVTATSTLIDSVHDVAQRPGTAAAGRWRFDNVIGIDTPRVVDCPIDERHRHVSPSHRPIAAVSVVAQESVTVDVVFDIGRELATAVFLSARTTTGEPDERSTALALHLASETRAALVAVGLTARLRPLDNC
ncbi:hypothetical protein [Skermania piniformis]|uniref:Uncharacterized protein n=1 Tax=Skermania pinensis TaxID=39122 RepID=A0ABX8S449_9ACTN|nr:hypothetical protein [Skermania piniformis]QXQ12508.1 hypothetical protein KV203_10995 [Skermania piniformis]